MKISVSFIGLTYIIIYVGAILILFLFILMMINIKYIDLKKDIKSILPLSNLIILFISIKMIEIYDNINGIKINYITSINNWENLIFSLNEIKTIGLYIYTNNILLLIIILIILLLAMIYPIIYFKDDNYNN